MEIKKGDTVTWSSQAGGSCKEKIGIVVEVFPSGFAPTELYDQYAKTHAMMFDRPVWCRPDYQIGYFVEVNESKTGRGKPKLYWPKTKQIHIGA